MGGSAVVRKARSIFISDVHLGSKFAKASDLKTFLKTHQPEYLYIVGDFIDGWKFASGSWVWDDACNNLIRKILKMNKSGTKVFYVVGNHDEFLRNFFHKGQTADHFGSIAFANSFVHRGLNGMDYLVVHGDAFDTVIEYAPWMAWLGDLGYEALLRMNHWINKVRISLGFRYWSFSKLVKQKVKEAASHIARFEDHLAHTAKQQGCGGVVVGHIHHPDHKTIGDVTYFNTGDWVESCSALVEYEDGVWELLTNLQGVEHA